MKKPILMFLVCFCFIQSKAQITKSRIIADESLPPNATKHSIKKVIHQPNFTLVSTSTGTNGMKPDTTGLGLDYIAIGNTIDDITTSMSIPGAVPEDNTITVSCKDGSDTLMSAKNSAISIYAPNGSILSNDSLKTFTFTQPGNNYKYGDPKLIYDPQNHRYLMVYHGLPKTHRDSSVLYFKISATSNPFGFWYEYAIHDSSIAGSQWIDRPEIVLSTEEVFIKVNMFQTDTTTFKSVHLFVFKQSEVYQMNPPTVTYYDIILPYANPSSIPILYGHGSNYGPGIYLAQLEPESFGDSMRLYDITNHIYTQAYTIDMYKIKVALNSGDLWFSNSPINLKQKNSTLQLKTGSSKILSAFYLNNGFIHFVFPKYRNPTNLRCATVYARLNIATKNVKYTTYQFGNAAYPSLTSLAADTSDKSVVIAYLTADSLTFPSFRAVLCRNDMTWGNDLLIKAGTNPRYESRWGDYTGNVRKHNAGIPSSWVYGSYAGSIGNTSVSYIAQILKTNTNGIDYIAEAIPIKVYPNPATKQLSIDIDKNISENIAVDLIGLNGVIIGNLYSGKSMLMPRSLILPFISQGEYILRVSSENKVGYEKVFLY